MPRPRRHRWVWMEPQFTYFKPAGVPLAQSGIVYLKVDEFEAIRLADMEKLTQTAAAKKMKISQPTFNRLLEAAHEKIAKALVDGSAIRIEGGSYISQEAVNKIKKGGAVMKIAVSTMTGGLEDVITPAFGRCANYTIVEVEDKGIKGANVVPNPAAQMPGGAGIQAATNVVNEGVSVVLTGNIGPNALPILSQAGVKVYSAGGMKVKDAVQAYLDGKLTEMGAPTVPGMAPGTGMGRGMGRGAGRGMGRGRQFKGGE